jgi:pimeloyl-ACP methyl ester carboxylesterase
MNIAKGLAFAGACLIGSFGAFAQGITGASPGAIAPESVVKESIVTFSTANIARQGHFYIGGHYVADPNKPPNANLTMDGAMYVEVWVPKKIRHPYPMVFFTGGGGQGAYSLMQTPDGRPGWAYDFVNQGYTVYMMDYPGQGRSAYLAGVDGPLLPPRSGPLMEEIWTGGRPPATPQSTWPQYTKYSAWPSNAPNKGKMGDPVFDYFAKTEMQVMVVTPEFEKRTVDAMQQLIDAIGKPVVLMINSGIAATAWAVADSRANRVKGIIAAEPVAPPIGNAERGATGMGRLWGLSNLPLHYEPPIHEPSELRPAREAKADGPDLLPCWVQQEPAHKLVNMQSIPILAVSGEASYHRPYSHCVAKWLNQAGVKTTFVRLEDVGLSGNGHQFMSEKNSAGISAYFINWLAKNVR